MCHLDAAGAALRKRGVVDTAKLRVPMHDGVFVDCGLFGAALRCGCPGIQLGPGAYLPAGWEAWARFCQHASPGERDAARVALAQRETA
jgi:hypothetical protein